MLQCYIGGAVAGYLVALIEIVRIIFYVAEEKYEDVKICTVTYIGASVVFLFCILMCCRYWFGG